MAAALPQQQRSRHAAPSSSGVKTGGAAGSTNDLPFPYSSKLSSDEPVRVSSSAAAVHLWPEPLSEGKLGGHRASSGHVLPAQEVDAVEGKLLLVRMQCNLRDR